METDAKTQITTKDIDDFLEGLQVSGGLPVSASDKTFGKKSLYRLLKNSKANIRLRRPILGDTGAKLVARCLDTNTKCTALDLSTNNISNEGIKALCESLKHNATLTTLVLDYSDIGAQGAKAIGDMLKPNRSLVQLRLSSSKIAGNDVQAICAGLEENRTLTKLIMHSNRIGDDGAKSISNCLKRNRTLTELDLDKNGIGNEGTKAISRALKENVTLLDLKLAGNQIGTAGMLALANACKIRGKALILDFASQAMADVDMRFFDVEPDKLKCIAEIGVGNFGAAYRGTYARWQARHCCIQNTGCVIKFAHDEHSGESLYETILLGCLPEHDNLLKLVGICENYEINNVKHQVMVVAELKGGSVKSYVTERRGKLPLSEQLSFGLQMSRALQHIHKFGMVHRDLALRNFVLSEDYTQVVLIDFGLSYILEDEDSKQIVDDTKLDLSLLSVGSILQAKGPAGRWRQGIVKEVDGQNSRILVLFKGMDHSDGEQSSNTMVFQHYEEWIDSDSDRILNNRQQKELVPFYARNGEQLPMKLLAPESFCPPYPYFLSSDVWMLGLAFWEMLHQFKGKPFHSSGGMHKHRSFLFNRMVVQGKSVPLFLKRCPPEWKELIEFCCDFDFMKRPTATDVLGRIGEVMERLEEQKSVAMLQNEQSPDEPEDSVDLDDISDGDEVSPESDGDEVPPEAAGDYNDLDEEVSAGDYNDLDDSEQSDAEGSDADLEDDLGAYVGKKDGDGDYGGLDTSDETPDETVDGIVDEADYPNALKGYYKRVHGVNFWEVV